MNLKKILAVTILFPAFIGAMDPSIKRGTASSSASSSSSNSAPREYVDFQDKDIPYIESIYAGHEQKKMIDITYLVGNNFNYYKGYRAKRIKENVVSFPLEACTPIPFKIYGDLHYFISSAVRGTNLRHATGFWGSGYEITDPNITRVVAVRGKTEGGRWSQIYLGLDAGEKKGKNIIYKAKPLLIQFKSKTSVTNTGTIRFPDVKYLSNMQMGQAVRKQHPEVKPSWNNPAFVKIINDVFASEDGLTIQDQHLISKNFYWE